MPEMDRLLDQPATVEWMDEMNSSTDGKPMPNLHKRDFRSVGDAVKFITETLTNGRDSALIHTESGTLQRADIERLYSTLR
jgi:hypothetical protein